MRSRSFAAIVFLVLLQAVVFLGVCRKWSAPLGGDEPVYRQLAMNMLEGKGFSLAAVWPYEPTIFRTPGYPLILAGLLAGSDNSPGWARLAQFGILGASALLLGALVRKAWGWEAGLLASLLCASYAILGQYAALLSTEILSAFLWLLLSVLVSRTLTPFRNETDLLAAGLTSGLLALVRPSLTPLVAMPLVAAFLSGRRQGLRRAAVGTAWVALGFAVVVSPWLVRNRAVAGRATLAVGGGMSLYLSAGQYGGRFTYALLASEFKAITDDWHILQARASASCATSVSPNTCMETAVDAEYLQEARQLARGLELFPALTQIPKRCAYLWSSSSFLDRNQYPTMDLLVRAQHNAIIVLAGIGMVLLRRRLLRDWAVWVPLLYITALHLVFHEEARYSVPARPFLIAYATVPLVWIGRRTRSPQFARLESNRAHAVGNVTAIRTPLSRRLAIPSRFPHHPTRAVG